MSTQGQQMPTTEQMLANPVASQVIVAQALASESTQTMSWLTQMQMAFNTGGLKEAANAALTGVLGGIFQAGGAAVGATVSGFQAGFENAANSAKSKLKTEYFGEPVVEKNAAGKNIVVEGKITDVNRNIKNANGSSVKVGAEAGASSVNTESYRNDSKRLDREYKAKKNQIDHTLKERNYSVQGLQIMQKGGDVLGKSIFDGAAQLQNKGSQVLSQAGDSLDKSVQGLKAAIEALAREIGQAVAAQLAFSSR